MMTQLALLDLADNRIDPSGALVLANALMCTTNLTSLDLRNNAIGYAQPIAEVLRHTTRLVELRLGGNKCGAAGAEVLAEALPRSLVTLDLSRNGIRVRGAAAVAAALPLLGNLARLDLGNNLMGVAGARAVAAALEHTPRLMELSLGSDLGRRGMAAAAEVPASTQSSLVGHTSEMYSAPGRAPLLSVVYRRPPEEEDAEASGCLVSGLGPALR